MFAMPSVQGAARVLSRRRILAAAAAAVVVTCVTPLGAALVLAPLTALAVGVLLPFALLWVDFEYEVPLDYWDGLYKSRFGTSGVAARNGPRGETPPVYPNGWFKIAESAEVPPGAVKVESVATCLSLLTLLSACASWGRSWCCSAGPGGSWVWWTPTVRISVRTWVSEAR
jgi:hypothetical protein